MDLASREASSSLCAIVSSAIFFIGAPLCWGDKALHAGKAAAAAATAVFTSDKEASWTINTRCVSRACQFKPSHLCQCAPLATKSPE